MTPVLYTFDPMKLSNRDLKNLADNIEEYLSLLEEVMLFPEELLDSRKEFDDSIKTVVTLIKKLLKGDRSVFKDDED